MQNANNITSSQNKSKKILVSPLPFKYQSIIKDYKPIDFTWYKNELVIVYLEEAENDEDDAMLQQYVTEDGTKITTLNYGSEEYDYMHFETIDECGFCVCTWLEMPDENCKSTFYMHYYDGTEWHNFGVTDQFASQAVHIVNVTVTANTWKGHLVLIIMVNDEENEYSKVLFVDWRNKTLAKSIKLLGPTEFKDPFGAHHDGIVAVRSQLMYLTYLPHNIATAPNELSLQPCFDLSCSIVCGSFVIRSGYLICIGSNSWAFHLKTQRLFHLDLITPRYVPEFSDGQKCWWINMLSHSSADLIVKNRSQKKKKELWHAFFGTLYMYDIVTVAAFFDTQFLFA